MKEYCRKNSVDIGILCFLSLLVLYQVLRLGDLPGIYFDGLMADFSAVSFLNPQYDWNLHAKQLFDFNFIGAIYHGNLTMFTSLFGNLLTGTTSVLQYHIQYALWAITIVITFYIVLKRAGVDLKIVVVASCFLASSPAFITTIFTQSYSFLPGTVCMLLSVYYYMRWLENENKKNLWLIGVLGGLAIYSYFVYLFFIPAILISVLFSDIKKWFVNFCVLLLGYLTGVYFYLLGFISIFLREYLQETRIAYIIFGLTAIFLIVILGWIYNQLVKRDICGKMGYISLIILSIVIVIWGIVFVLPIINLFIENYNVAGNPLSVVSRIEKIGMDITNCLANLNGEMLILGERISWLANLWRNIFCTLTLIWLMCKFYFGTKKEKKKKVSADVFVLFLVISYIVCALIFASRLSAHHFSTFQVVTVLCAGLEAQDIINKIRQGKEKGIQCIILVFAISMCVNFINNGRVAIYIKNTGGRGYCTNQTTELANQALRNLQEGKKEFYIFPEWGFWTSFIYLTGNNIPFSTSEGLYEGFLEKKYSEGYDIVVAFWNEDNLSEYLNKLQIRDDISVNIDEYKTLNGEYAFTTIEVTIDEERRENK